ncbi:AAA domain-containing protein [Trichoderma simmonsii]|uniref:AAA domain-containing protein n=1 Tax=Trichoderma simmonsii TaxID=1491479 RepID=A0A8G0LPU6_9HYPO|nr:AAA domain-containing protein [Trichoderma simmonsii]
MDLLADELSDLSKIQNDTESADDSSVGAELLIAANGNTNTNLKQWFKDMTDGRSRVVIFKSTQDELKTCGERLDDLAKTLFKQARKENPDSPLKWTLVAHLHEIDGGVSYGTSMNNLTPEATSYIENVDCSVTWFSIPILNHMDMKDTQRSLHPNRFHYSIEIPKVNGDLPRANPLKEGAELTRTGSNLSETAASLDIAIEQGGSHEILHELPEWLLVNSLRLRRFLDYEFCDGTLPCSTEDPFLILRPFKMLVYLRGKIKKRIRSFKLARTKLLDTSDEEYVKRYKEEPVEDIGMRGYQNQSLMDLSTLTGWILDLGCVEEFIDTYIEPQRVHLASAPASVRFLDMWFLFPIGALVYVRDNNTPQKIWRVVQTAGGRKWMSKAPLVSEGSNENTFSDFVLDCYYLDYTGHEYVPVYARFSITNFAGIQSTATLPVIPFTIALDQGYVIKEELLTRAAKFQELTQVSHRHYSGRSQDRTPWGTKLLELGTNALENVSIYSERVDSEVIVDFQRAIQEVSSWNPTAGTSLQPHIDDSHERPSDTDPDSQWSRKFTQDYIATETLKWDQWAKKGSGPTDEEDLFLLPDRIFAFVLKTRTWACLHLGKNAFGEEQLTEIIPQKHPWDNLELPLGHKEIVQSLIESHFSNNVGKQMHFDLVKGKGKGVIILLHGVPGVGKTSTAECAAESNGRPLLPIICGDLGLTPSEVEVKLQHIFRLAQAWGCVMLLDEADVFLAQRTATDTERNALVSVFLRTLEYYEGILFLTTNRVGVFDEAFKSRIHISLYYPPLQQDQTLKIWKSHIQKAIQDPRIKIDSDQLILCANDIFERQLDPQFGPVWNGRQIRNAFQSAVALACFHAKTGGPIQLETKYFKQVFDVSDQTTCGWSGSAIRMHNGI